MTENDIISRQQAINVLHEYFDTMLDTDTVCPKDIYGLFECIPSTHVEREEGYWIKKVRKSYPWHECTGHDADGNIHTIRFKKEEITTTYRCSKCGFVVWDFEENYCPDCGRRMKKSENKETDSK